MLSGDNNESRQQKNNLQDTFLVHFFAVVLHDYNETETSQLQPLFTRFMEKMLYMYVLLFPFFFFSLPLISPLVATTSIYHFLIAAIKFFVFFLTKLVSFVFYLSLQPFLYYPRQQGHRLLTCGRFSQNQKPNFLTYGTPLLKC